MDYSGRAQFVPEFSDVAFSLTDKNTVSKIVKTEYGYHIMYFVGASDEAVWYTNIKTALADSQFETMYNDMSAKHVSKTNEKVVAWSLKDINKHINDYLIQH